MLSGLTATACFTLAALTAQRIAGVADIGGAAASRCAPMTLASLSTARSAIPPHSMTGPVDATPIPDLNAGRRVRCVVMA